MRERIRGRRGGGVEWEGGREEGVEWNGGRGGEIGTGVG